MATRFASNGMATSVRHNDEMLHVTIRVPAGTLTPLLATKIGESVRRDVTRKLMEMYCEEHGHTFDDKRPNAETLCTVCHHFIGAVPA